MDAGTLQLSGLCPLLSGVGTLVAKAQSNEHEGPQKREFSNHILCPLLSGVGTLVAKAQSKEHEGPQ